MRHVIFLTALAAGSLTLADPAAGYVMLGSGSASCAAWTTARQAPQSRDAGMQEQWVLGFLSGVGFPALGELDPLHGIDADAVYRWVDGYCRDHPQQKIQDAAHVFLQEHPR